jgi:hypothetical protein
MLGDIDRNTWLIFPNILLDDTFVLLLLPLLSVLFPVLFAAISHEYTVNSGDCSKFETPLNKDKEVDEEVAL